HRFVRAPRLRAPRAVRRLPGRSAVAVHGDEAVSRLAGNMRSIRAMLVCVAMFSIMDMTMKLLSAHFPALQVAAIRALSALPLVGAYLFWRGGQRSLLRIRWSLHLLRGAIGIA